MRAFFYAPLIIGLMLVSSITIAPVAGPLITGLMLVSSVTTMPVAEVQSSNSPTIGQIQSNPGAFLNRVVIISGTVGTYVDDNEFLLDDGTGQIVVDPGPPWFRRITLTPGAPVVVTGKIDRTRRGGVDLDACRIETPDTTIQIRDCSFNGPPPWAGGPNRRGR